MLTSSYAVEVVEMPSTTYIITSESNDIPLELQEQLNSLGAEVTSIFEGTGIAIATSTLPEFATEASKIEGIQFVAPDVQIQWLNPQVSDQQVPYTNPPTSRDNDNYFNLQWGLDAINAIEAWNLGYRGAGITIAVLDSGFDLNHPDLLPNTIIEKSGSFVPGEGLQHVGTGFSHGSHVAGIVAGADNGIGIIGVAPDAKMMLLKVLRDAGTGDLSWALNAIIYAANQGADIINMSFGVVSNSADPYLQVINRATTYAYERGVTLIAAIGNDALNLNGNNMFVITPAEADHVISIGATTPIGWALAPTATSFDYIADYSNYGYPGVDFSAPGGDDQYTGAERATIGGITAPVKTLDQVFSANIGGWIWSAGTSMASPHAAGIAALVIQRFGGRGRITPDQVERVLAVSSYDFGAPGPDPYYGIGRLDAYRAVLCTNRCLA